MEDDKVDPGHFQPIAQMRRLAMVLPRSLEIVNPIPVKLCLPVQATTESWLDSLSEKPLDTSYKDEESEHEKNKDIKVITTNGEDIKETNSLEQTSDKQARRPDSITDMADNEIERPDNQVENSKTQVVKPMNQKKMPDRQVLKSDKQIQTADKEEVDSGRQLKNSGKSVSRKRAKDSRETPDLESSSRQSEQMENNDGSESETGTVHSVAIQVNFLPGRNQRAIPHSRSSSQNSYKLPMTKEHDEKLQHHRRRKDSASRSQIFRCEKEKDLLEFLVQERKNEQKRDKHRHLVQRMINDEYKKKCIINNGRAVDRKWKNHNSRRSPSTQLEKHNSNQDASKRLTNWVRSQHGRKHARGGAPSPLGSDVGDAEDIVKLVREEFKHLGFL